MPSSSAVLHSPMSDFASMFLKDCWSVCTSLSLLSSCGSGMRGHLTGAAGKHRGQRAHLIEVVGEAGHPQVEDLAGLLAADVRRLAGLHVHPGPLTDVVVDDAREAPPRGLGGRLAVRDE